MMKSKYKISVMIPFQCRHFTPPKNVTKLTSNMTSPPPPHQNFWLYASVDSLDTLRISVFSRPYFKS